MWFLWFIIVYQDEWLSIFVVACGALLYLKMSDCEISMIVLLYCFHDWLKYLSHYCISRWVTVNSISNYIGACVALMYLKIHVPVYVTHYIISRRLTLRKFWNFVFYRPKFIFLLKTGNLVSVSCNFYWFLLCVDFGVKCKYLEV